MAAAPFTLARSQPVAAAALAVAVVGIAAILGAYFFQFVIGLKPCPLCLEQRIAYYVSIPLAAMILLGLSVGSSRKVLILGLAAIAVAMLYNAGLGVYHSGVARCRSPEVRSDPGVPRALGLFRMAHHRPAAQKNRAAGAATAV